MGKFTSFQVKLITIIVVISTCLIGLFLFMVKSMTTYNGNINISKIETKDKVYTYDIYSDFYFNIYRYNEKGEKSSYFSQLIPTRASIGYDFSKEKPELIVKNYDNLSELQLTTSNDNELSKQIDIIKKFSKEYSLISAIQDQHYFKENIKKSQEILQDLYNIKIDLPLDYANSFYENEIPTVISNIAIKTPKLNNIPKNLKAFEKCDKAEWCSNLVKWQFGEDDNISFEYVTNIEKMDLDEFLNSQKKNVNIIKITKINNNNISKFFILIPDKINEIRSYFIDNNGYVYLLRYKYKNSTSLEKYQNDFIKIAYGINFIDAKNFENKYAQIQNMMNEYKAKLKEITELNKELSQFNMYEHFKLHSNSDLKLEEIYSIYQNDKNYMETIQKEYDDKYLLKEAVTGLGSVGGLNISTIFKDKYSSKLKELCSDLECVKKLKANNWKEEEK